MTVANAVYTNPIGLVDDNETPEQAAIRELEEETGFKADSVISSTSLLASDPGTASIVINSF